MKKIVAFLLILLVILVLYYLAISNIPDIMAFFDGDMKDACIDKRGQFGDSTAIVNTLFSALALFGVLLTLFYQMQDNKEQKRLSDISRFEQNFFTMTGNLENIVSNLNYTEHLTNPFVQQPVNMPLGIPLDNIIGNNTPTVSYGNDLIIKGREIFEYIYNRQAIDGNITGIKQAIANGGLRSYEQAMSHGVLDHYFRYLYRIIKYVDDCELFLKDSARKQYYVSILRAQVSCYELLLIFYNCQLHSHNKFKKFIEDYTFFNNLRTELLATQEDISVYDSKISDVHQVDAEVMPAYEYAKSAFMRPQEYMTTAQQQQSRLSFLRRCFRDVRAIGSLEERIHRVEAAVHVLKGRAGL